MNRIIRYGVDADTGLVASEVDGVMAYPVLDFAAIGMGGDGFEPGDFRGPMRFKLEKLSGEERRAAYREGMRFTKKIPVKTKNLHRVFWGFKPLKEDS